MENTKSFEELRTAAKAGEAEAQFSLGLKYFQGDGVEEDCYYAFKYFEKAANQNHAEAQYFMGLCYEDGRGVDANAETAMKWYQKSAGQGNEGAFSNWAGMYLYNTEKQDVDKAIEIYRQGAEKGFTDLQCELAALYKNEKDDLQEAVKWYSLAAEQNDGYAQYVLGHMYRNGEYFDQDEKKGLELYVKSAENGCFFAMSELGDYHFYRFNNCVDYAKASEYYEKALAVAQKINFYNAKYILKNLLDCFAFGKDIPGGKARYLELSQMAKEIALKEKLEKKAEKLKKKLEKKEEKNKSKYLR